MAIPRASSGMLRSQIRPAASRTAAAPHLRSAAVAGHQQLRTTAKTYGKDDLGGPGGQEPRPSRPAGPEVVKRNWPAIGGAALVAVGAFAYFSSSGPSKKDEEKLKAKAQAEADRLKQKGQEGLRKIEGKDGAGPVGELSGRKGGMGGFRGE